MTDSALYDGISRRDDSTFQWLYEHNYQMIKSMVLNNSGTEEDAVDVFQEGMIALWVNVRKGSFQLTETAKISTYFFRLCSNLWISRLRKKKLTVISEDKADLSNIAEDAADLESYERIKLIEEGIKSLGDNCQRILKLFYYKKASIREIALQLNLTEKSAKNGKYRCLQKLKLSCINSMNL